MFRRLQVVSPAVAAATAGLFVLTSVLVAQPPKADAPVADKPEAKSTGELRRPQEQNEKLFRELTRGLLALAQKLDRSDKPEDRDRAKTIRAALDLAEKESVDNKFQALIAGMSKGSNRHQDVTELIGKNSELTKALTEMLAILMTDDESARLKAEIDKLEKFLKEAQEIKRKQENIRAMTDAQKGDPSKIAKSQGDLAKQTEELGKRMGGQQKGGEKSDKPAAKPDPKAEPKAGEKPGDSAAEPKPDPDEAKKPGDPKAGGDPKSGEPKPGDPKPGDPKSGDPKSGDPKPTDPKNADPKPGDPKNAEPKPGDPKDGEPKPGEPKPGDAKGQSKSAKGAEQAGQGRGKNAPKSGEQQAQSKGGGQSGPPKEGSPGQSPPQQANQNQPQTPGRKQIQEAYPFQEKAEEDLKKDQRDASSKKQDKAIEKIAEAIEALKKRLKQLREEELLKTLAALEARCNRMLSMQIEVYEQTKGIHQTVLKNGGQKTNAEIQKAQGQSEKEKEIIAEADKALKLLESEGSAVAFAQVLEEVRGDMVSVQRRLEDARVDTDTQAIEENIIAMLKDMIAALKKAQQDIQNQQGQPNPNSGKPPPQRLIDMLAELRLIRALQMQVNGRTKMYAAKYQGEQTADPLIQAELQQLSARQTKLQDMIQKIATGANQ